MRGRDKNLLASARIVETRSGLTWNDFRAEQIAADLVMTTPAIRPASTRQYRAMRCLAIDAVTAGIVGRLRAQGIRSLLLKGPSIAHWLYEPPYERTYGDIDLIVDGERFTEAEAVLAAAGFHYALAGAAPAEKASTHDWLSPGPLPVRLDLHRTFHHVTAPDAETWRELSASTEWLSVSGEDVEIPSEAGRCLIVALHASSHGDRVAWPLRDLTLAVGRGSDEAWTEAAAMASRLGASNAFLVGLRLVPRGVRLAASLGEEPQLSTELALLAGSEPMQAVILERLLTMPGAWAKTRFLARRMAPTPAAMRYRYAIEETQRFRLALAYPRRWTHLVKDFPVSARAWRRARKAA